MAEPRWLNEEEMRAWEAFLAATALVNRRIEQQLKDEAHLSHTQYEVLVRLARAPGKELRMTELSAALFTSKSGLTYQIDQLAKAGFVRRGPAPDDPRGVLAALTPAGLRKLESAAPGHVALVRDLLIDVLTPAQRTALADGLGEVAKRLC
ncbi:DNA-binding MarR family transcriptional regulator [Nocardia tenerifensis]|uniref:DNA-binding MarR family transcriptional regulator n=1 Tax=Nocardia tenerifensis TaxID=228006 RepID=A0A318KEE4_9NOCA|nr:MarR family transcriptional regulator [Nocardia tenerifensis]PXX71169.1 DNA-binding MarR family transcriptional regulator [Nocardia tenerifensis]